MGYSEANIHCHAVPKTVDNRATEWAERFFVDLAGDMLMHSSGGSKYVVILVDICTWFKVVKILGKKSDVTSVVRSFIADFITPEKLATDAIRTNNGGEFEAGFQYLLDELEINHEHMSPDKPQYNGVAERALDLLRDTMIALMQDLKEGANDQLWVETMNYACNVTNVNKTTSNEGGATPNEKWYGIAPSLNQS